MRVRWRCVGAHTSMSSMMTVSEAKSPDHFVTLSSSACWNQEKAAYTEIE